MEEQQTHKEVEQYNQSIIKYIIWVTCLVPVFVIGMYYFVMWATWEFDADFMQADSCLDAGGVWDKTYGDDGRCWHAGQCEDQDGFWYPAENRCVFNETEN